MRSLFIYSIITSSRSFHEPSNPSRSSVLALLPAFLHVLAQLFQRLVRALKNFHPPFRHRVFFAPLLRVTSPRIATGLLLLLRFSSPPVRLFLLDVVLRSVASSSSSPRSSATLLQLLRRFLVFHFRHNRHALVNSVLFRTYARLNEASFLHLLKTF